ncbi:unnamed protein product [Chrysodeixis includens]|uniref:Uncharacterized protein n=1 Tax=Chrysodeixis includens TaxID=689277 RepID=A0A9N8L677_CHRIL|nr:unnamed protein product [Chrysodeixis includens]
MKQNRRFIQQFPVEKNNQQNYTEIVNMTIFTNIFTAILYNCSATSCGRSRTSSIPMGRRARRYKIIIFTTNVRLHCQLQANKAKGNHNVWGRAATTRAPPKLEFRNL